MAKVLFSEFAQADLAEITDYYISLSPDYVERTLDGIEKQINSLKDFPRSGRIVPELEKQGIMKFRQLIEGYYRIVYEIVVEEDNETVYVHTIIDGRMDFAEVLVKRLMRERGES